MNVERMPFARAGAAVKEAGDDDASLVALVRLALCPLASFPSPQRTAWPLHSGPLDCLSSEGAVGPPPLSPFAKALGQASSPPARLEQAMQHELEEKRER